MKTGVVSNSNRSWTDPEVTVLKRIVKHAKREGKTMKEGFEQAAYRLERTASAVYQFWHANITQDYKDYVRNITSENPTGKGTLTPMEEAFAEAQDGYILEDLPFADVGDFIGDTEYRHPEQYHPPQADTRYNLPKAPPKASVDDVEEVIMDNAIYREVRGAMFEAQHRQVAYGLDKYPEPLNASTWTTLETLDHIISETVDKLHYLTMLKIKLQHETEE